MPNMDPNEIARVAVAAAQSCLTGAQVDMHASYMEAFRQAGIRKQGRLMTRPMVASLYVSLTSAVITGNNSYRVPNGEVFLIKEMRGAFGFNDANGEALTLGNFTAMTPREWMLAKAASCTITLQRVDQGNDIFDNNDFPLSAILAELGAPPIRFDENGPGWIIPPNQTVQMTAALNDSGGSSGESSKYGVILSGTLLSII